MVHGVLSSLEYELLSLLLFKSYSVFESCSDLDINVFIDMLRQRKLFQISAIGKKKKKRVPN